MDQTDVTTPNPCLLTLEEQLAILAILKKTVIRLGINGLPTAPSSNPFGTSGLGPNLRINSSLLDTIQNIRTTDSPYFYDIHASNSVYASNYLIGAGLVINGILYPSAINLNELLIGAGTSSIGIIAAPSPNLIFISDGSGTPIWLALGPNIVNSGININTVQDIDVTDSPRFASLSLGAASVKHTINTNGLPTKSNNVSLVGQGNAIIVAHGSATAQTGAITSLTSYTTIAAGSFEIGGYIDVTAFTAGTISMTCTYTDPAGNSQTLTIPLVALAGTIGTTAGSLTDAQALVVSIRTSGANPITIATTVSLFTGTYNAYAWIKQIA